MASYMRALKDGGILSVTLWNKEEPPKSVLKLYATMAEAARQIDGGDIADRFFVASSYLSTATVLYKRGGFTPEEIDQAARAYRAPCRSTRSTIRASPTTPRTPRPSSTTTRTRSSPTAPTEDPARRPMRAKAARRARRPDERRLLPATTMGQMAWHHLVHGGWDDVARRYVFDTRLLTNDRPYFAAYVKPADLPRVTDRLELLQDEWGFLLVWATLGHRLHRRPLARAAAACLRLAHHLQPQPRQVPHHRLLRLPRRRLHHGRGGPDLEVHPGAEQCHGLGLRAHHGHAGLLRLRQPRLRALLRPRAHASCRASSSPSAPC